MRAAATTILCLAALVASAAERPAWHATFQETLEAARAGDRLAMVVLVAPSRDARGRDVCEMLRTETLAHPPIARLVAEHFEPVVLDLADFQRRGRPLPRPVREAIEPAGAAVTVPQVLFFDAQGRLVDRIERYAPPEQYLPQVRKVAERAGAAPPPEDMEKVAERVERGGKSAEDYEDLRIAMKALDAALGGMAGKAPPEEKGPDADSAEGRAREKLREGQEFERIGRLGFAIKAYSECLRQYPDTPAARVARRRLEALRDHPAIRETYRQFRAEKLLARAREAIEKGQLAVADEALDTILDDLADTDAAEAARKLRQKLDAGPAAAETIRQQRAERDARRLLALARSYRLNGLRRKAIAHYRKVVEKYPGTPFAKAAREAIEELAER